MKPAFGLVADDLTGATDAAVQFARRGWRTQLLLDPKWEGLSDPISCLAITTDARAADDTTAAELTAQAMAQLMRAGVERIFLKIDSTMRGSVPGQIAGALTAWQTRYPAARAIVCSAYPQMGRTVSSNRLHVDGTPVEHTAIGRDPVTPVGTSDMASLIPGSRYSSVEEVARSSQLIATVDARTDDDLARLASAIDAGGPSLIPVGSAGLGLAIAARCSPGLSEPEKDAWPQLKMASRILILVTSLNPVSRVQIAKLGDAFPDVEVVLAPAERVGASSVAENLARAFADRVVRERWELVGLVGGDGARAALRYLETPAVRILDAVIEGIPLGIMVGGSAAGMPIFTKAGGFGAEDALVQLVQQLRS
jgi:uncharacterized protein YgbK (DUF1537 family)